MDPGRAGEGLSIYMTPHPGLGLQGLPRPMMLHGALCVILQQGCLCGSTEGGLLQALLGFGVTVAAASEFCEARQQAVVAREVC